jgi:hypothetical protein
MWAGTRIDYQTLRQINLEESRKAVLEYQKTYGDNIAEAARINVVFDYLLAFLFMLYFILHYAKSNKTMADCGNLNPRSR